MHKTGVKLRVSSFLHFGVSHPETSASNFIMATKRKLSQVEAPNSTSYTKIRALNGSDASENDLQGQAATDKHYAELYAKPPDFKELARRDPDFAQV
jgi:hypothetical protein